VVLAASLSRVDGFFMEPDVRSDIQAGRLVRVLNDWTPPLSGL